MYGRGDFFDYNMVKFWFDACGNDEFKSIFPFSKMRSTIVRSNWKRWNIPNQKLDTWARKLNLEHNHHDAKSDAQACYEVFKYQMENPDGDFFFF